MKNSRNFYNLTSFKYFRRQLKPIDINDAFIKLIETKEEQIKSQKAITKEKENQEIDRIINNKTNIENNNISNSNNTNNIYNNTDISKKNLCLELLYQKEELDKIKKIRDLFIEFDTDKSRSLDQKEIYLMFNINKIPIKYDEVKELFGFSRRNKYIQFSDFIDLTVNPEFSEKFKNFMMSKVRSRVKEGVICPNDFNDMLSHLCEFGQLPPELKNQSKNGINYKKNTRPSLPKYLLEYRKKRDSTFQKDKIFDLSKKKNIFKKKSFLENIRKKNDIFEEINGKEDNNNFNVNRNSVKNNNINNNTAFIKEAPNLFEMDREYSNFIELSRKKLYRFSQNLGNKNIKDKIRKRKEKLSQSLEMINNNTNSDIGDNFISYYPTENVFKKIKEDKIINFPTKINNESIPNIKSSINHSKDKRNSIKLNYDFNFRDKFQLLKLKNRFKLMNFIKKSNKKKKKELKDNDFISFLSSLNLNEPHFPIIRPKQKYSDNTFLTTTASNSNTYS